jgi:ketosteroid isomerase-like protein
MTTPAPLTTGEVLQAAEAMIGAFAASDTEAYFNCFDESATFIFYYEPARLESRAEYRVLWDAWMGQGVKVTSCRSLNQRVQLVGSCGVFTHDVESTFEENGELEQRRERETIIFARFDDGSIRSIHEHLSASP